MEIYKTINQAKSLILNLELSSSEEEKKKYVIRLKETLEELESEFIKLQETQDLVVSHLKQENSRLNRI